MASTCRATPLRDEVYCFWHSPEHAIEADQARRLGGLRRRREKTITAVYELEGLGSAVGIRRVLDIAVADALGLENSVARARVLIAAAMAATRLLEIEDSRPGGPSSPPTLPRSWRKRGDTPTRSWPNPGPPRR